jgi:hypothetical protein
MLALSPLFDFGSFKMKIPVVIQRKICEFLAQGNTSPTTVGVIAKKLDEIQIPVAEVLKSSNQEFVDIVQTGVAKNITKCKPLQILHISLIK